MSLDSEQNMKLVNISLGTAGRFVLRYNKLMDFLQKVPKVDMHARFGS